MVEKAESHVHTRVRARTADTTPPFLETRRLGPDEVMVHYRSSRKLCPVGEGFIRGIAAHFGERIEITHDVCMHRGAERCDLRVRRVA